jgi:hypothetical protein
MRWIILGIAILIAAFEVTNVFAAAAGCSTGARQNAAQISQVVSGQLVCAQKVGALTGNDRWAEEHKSTGKLWEQGKGTTSKVHPPHEVGSWAAVKIGSGGSDDVIRHSYSGGKTFDWSFFEEKSKAGPTLYRFCDTTASTTIATATVIAPNPSSTNACGF